LLNEIGSLFWYFEVRVQYRRIKVHFRYLISWWVLVVFYDISKLWRNGREKLPTFSLNSSTFSTIYQSSATFFEIKISSQPSNEQYCALHSFCDQCRTALANFVLINEHWQTRTMITATFIQTKSNYPPFLVPIVPLTSLLSY